MTVGDLDLDEHLHAFVEMQVRAGRHGDAGEVVREALRRYEIALSAERKRIESIRTVIREGRQAIAGGDFTTVATAGDAALLHARLTRGVVPSGTEHPR